jgi:outer membrane protein assembly factor BamC
MRILLLVLFFQLLVGCSWLTGDKGYFRDTTDDYRNARVSPEIKVPAGLNNEALQDIFVIPPITEDLRVTGHFDTPRPAPLAARKTEDLVRVQRLGEEEWMLVAVAPGQLWPQVRAFLTNSSLQLARVDARAGLIETGWLKPDHGGMDERYQFRIEQGVQRNTSELHVRQMALAGDTDSWPDASFDPGREKEMLMAVAEYVASNTDTAPVSMMAQQAISASGKVSMQEDADDIAYIRLELPYYRAWASVDRALRESNFKVRDRDRSGGIYYIRYVEESEEDSGWFDWLFGGDDQAESAAMTEQDFVLTLEKQSPEVIRITIAREDKEALTPAQSQSLLGLIKGNIS